MKVEIRLIIAAVCAVLYFIYRYITQHETDWYPVIVAFALVYFLAPYVFTRSFFLGNREPRKKIDASDSNKKD